MKNTGLDGVIAKIMSKEVVLVCGSGLSVPTFISVGPLKKKLEGLGAEGADLASLAASYESKTSRRSLYSLLMETYERPTSSPAQQLAALLPWKFVISMNYDAGLYYAYLTAHKKQPSVIVTEAELDDWLEAQERLPLIHPNGSVLRPMDTFVITEADYERHNTNNKLINFVRKKICEHPVVYLGFGQSEDYLNRALHLRAESPDQRGYLILMDDFEPGDSNSLNILRNLAKSFNIEVLHSQNALTFLKLALESQSELNKKAKELGFLARSTGNIYQLRMTYDTDVGTVGKELSLINAISDGDVPTATFYYNVAGSQAWLNLVQDDRYVYKKSLIALRSWLAEKIAEHVMASSELRPDFVCIGPGDGRKECEIVLAAHKIAKKDLVDDIASPTRVFLMDISPSLLAKANECFWSQCAIGKDFELEIICADIDRLPAHKNLLDEDRPNCFLLLGNTFGNFANTEKLVRVLSETCNSGDHLVLEVSIFESLREEFLKSIVSAYQIRAMKEYLMTPLRMCNLQVKESEVVVELEDHARIATLLRDRDVEGLKEVTELQLVGAYRPEKTTAVGSAKLGANQKRRIFVSKRFQSRHLMEIMRRYNFSFQTNCSIEHGLDFLIFKFDG